VPLMGISSAQHQKVQNANSTQPACTAQDTAHAISKTHESRCTYALMQASNAVKGC
jgi:hypothetical protein